MIKLLPKNEQIAFLVRHLLHELCREELENNDEKCGYLKIDSLIFSLHDKKQAGQLSVSQVKNDDGDQYICEWELLKK